MDTVKNRLFLIVVACLMFNTVWTQTPKQKVTPKEYSKWSTLSGEIISPDGLWTSYILQYENNRDTLFVRNTTGEKKYFFANATDIAFSPDSKTVGIQLTDHTFVIQDLKKDSNLKIKNVTRFEFSEAGNFLAVLQTMGTEKQLLMYNNKKELIKIIPNTYDFKISEDGKLAVYTSLGVSIGTPDEKFKQYVVVRDTVHKFKKIVWSKSGNILAFLQEENPIQANMPNHKLYCYNWAAKRLDMLDNKKEKLKALHISSDMQTPIILSADGSQVFFYFTSPKVQAPKSDTVEIWDAATKLVYPAQEIYGDLALIPKIAVWYVDNGLVNLLGTDELPMSVLTSDRKQLLTYSHLTNEPQYEMVSLVDYYLTTVKTGIKKLFLSKQTTAPYSIGSSPSGRYINYFRDGNWWIYDTTKEIHTNSTSNLEVSFDDVDFDDAGKSAGYRCPGWTTDDKYLIVYDKYDIWLISPDAKTQRRITHGRESKISFRICDYLYLREISQGSADFVKRHFDISKGLLLIAKGYDKATGYFYWNPKAKLKEIIYGSAKFSRLKKADKAEKYIFLEEDFETPPALRYATIGIKKTKKLFQSNPHFNNYEWGTSKLISYKNSKGEDLQGALFYPAGYQSGKKYPMIVYIYSRLSQEIHDYNNPTLYQPIGFPPSNYTTDGYLVLMPDIKYAVGFPDQSILDCVESAVNSVIVMGIVEPNHIGLIGHSYGGYETCLLLTKTSIFAAAVAGASVTNMLSSYLSINPENGAKMDWRYESQQYRMASTPFNNLEGYIKNSTVTQAGKITTPLLSWSGKEDASVDWRQSIELHLALRRLQKRNIFLAYPNQGHILTDELAQFDLTTRIKDWFNYYLKNKPSPNMEISTNQF
ncbi:prolyl oligopeptidase family serine peptidase [Flavobacterium sp. I-SCBP12n]|uniref:Prolyl oligopeptidase family serine peptidase n=1 Tax=Flavobacterium pygoscelis TaxID=2893176 RepID=A0A9X1XQY2_9FLAO|nr:prolyl oligopeptidase family serine peptidase [Flavobacterium pygoscelis]MCK8141449.1 prolyl oligopeptidase family serine peptidase [Flavobacterium pygoscelis]